MNALQSKYTFESATLSKLFLFGTCLYYFPMYQTHIYYFQWTEVVYFKDSILDAPNYLTTRNSAPRANTIGRSAHFASSAGTSEKNGDRDRDR